MMKMATALIQCMMRSGRGWRRRSLRGVDVTIWLDIDDFPLTGGPASPPELGCEPRSFHYYLLSRFRQGMGSMAFLRNT